MSRQSRLHVKNTVCSLSVLRNAFVCLYDDERILSAIAKFLVYLFGEGEGRAEKEEERGRGKDEGRKIGMREK